MSDTVKLADGYNAIRPPDGEWEIWYDDGMETDLPNLPAVLTSEEVARITNRYLELLEERRAVGRILGRQESREEIKRAFATVFEPLKELFRE